jgi:predicted AlkP superfamily pyrophosphatase or phosphodiesterase
MMAGHGGPNVTAIWNEETTGAWATSAAYARGVSPVLSPFIAAHPILEAEGSEWKRVLPETSYTGRDDGPGEPAANRFPHWLEHPARTSRTSPTFTEVWEQSPWPDAYLANLSRFAVERLKLGQQAQTDMLAISFSSLDAVGHRYGPRSHEVQDTLARLDTILGGLIADLDRLVGRDRYVLALSADHGVAEIPEQVQPAGTAGRVTLGPIATAAEDALDKVFGRGQYVEAIAANGVYFRPGVAARIQATPGARDAVESALLASRGMARIFWADALAGTAPTSDDLLIMARRSYMAGRSGDIEFILRPNWMAVGTGTTHGSPYPYDREVPIVFLGGGIGAGRYPGRATPADIAPTLAALAKLTLPKTDGRVLAEVIAGR